MTLLFESALKSSLVLLVALALMPWLRTRSASLRHWVLSMAVVCAAAIPAVQFVVPEWQIRSLSWSVDNGAGPLASATAAVPEGPNAARSHPQQRADTIVPPSPVALAPTVLAIWMAGASIGVIVLLVGFARLGALASRSRPIAHGAWEECARRICREYGFTRPVRLLQGADPSLLVTWGLMRPKVIVPSAATDWPAARVSLVLYHELAHVRRGDWVIQMVAELLRAAYWFNPLVWIVCARLRQESEQACDDAVLARGVDGSEYATELLDIARDLRNRRLWLPAQAIARPSSLERRVRAMLDSSRNRVPLSRSASFAALLLVLAITVPIAGFAAIQSFGSLTGSIVDPTNAVLPGVTLVLTNEQTKAKYEVQTDRNGRYEFVGLPPGEYSFESKLPGFLTFRGRVAVTGQRLQQDLTLQIGELQETITVVGGPTASEPPPPMDPEKARLLDLRIEKLRSQRCPGNAQQTETRIGGNLRQPMKIRDVRPIYPPHNAEGTVELRAVIGEDGRVRDITAVSSPHPDLTQSAITAVSAWEFTETLLNCAPIPVTMNVTVNFKYRQ